MRTSRTERLRLRAEGGITIVEAIMSATILLIGLLSGFLALDASSSATKTAERQAVAASIGERQIENMQAMAWSQLVLCQTPTPNADPGAPAGEQPENPDYYVQGGGTLQVKDDYRNPLSGALSGTPANGEPLIVSAANPCNASTTTSVYPGPIPFSSGGVTGEYWRFVTWRDDVCGPGLGGNLTGLLPGALNLLGSLLTWLLGNVDDDVDDACASVQDAKRVTVAVVIDEASDYGPRKPTWISTIVPNTNGGPILFSNDLYEFP